MVAKLSGPEQDQAATLVAHFHALIHAWFTNDTEETARMRSELERLGVKVRPIRRRPPGKGVPDAE